MARTFLYDFSDLPLVVELGRSGGWVNGRAEIAYTSDVSDFSVVAIELDGNRPATEEEKMLARLFGKRLKQFHPCYVPVDGSLEVMIRQRLENEKAEDVMEAIRNELEAERQYQIDNAADRRRDYRVLA